MDVFDPDWIKPGIWDRDHLFQWTGSFGKSHWYTPDFCSPKYELYFETKGYWTKDQLDKKKFIEGIKNLIIVYKKDLELMESQNLIFTS